MSWMASHSGIGFHWSTTIGLLLTLVLIFMGQSEVILENPLHIVLIAIPMILLVRIANNTQKRLQDF